MKQGKVPKKVTLVLGALVLVIWGRVAMNIAGSVSGNDVATSAVATDNLHPELRESPKIYAFMKDIRDPFLYKHTYRKDSLKVALHAKPVWSPPPFKLTGILSAGGNHTAMVEGSGGAVFFLKEKDTLSGVKIIKIKDQIVTYYYQKKKTDWVLEKP